MDKARYVIAVLMIVTLPPALVLWFVIHPAARFWRRLGAGWTYSILSVPSIAAMVLAYRFRAVLLGRDLGTNYILISLAIVLAVISGWIAVKRRRHLSMKILVGIPEMSKSGDRGKLLTEGIYSRIRHPRYVEVAVGVWAYALFANYVGVHVFAVATIPILLFIIYFEERELRDRFGQDYIDYCARVPRFIPRKKVEAS